jgi:hypothetical protein
MKQEKLIYSVGIKKMLEDFIGFFTPLNEATDELETSKVAALCLMI